ncbi:MAG: choice-of-anchor D domain-containing protein [Myxococcota bacterium]
MRWFAVLVAPWLAGCTEYTLRLAEPEVGLSDDAFRFSGVVVGAEERRTVTVANSGLGDLVIEGLVLTDDASVFALTAPERLRVGPRGGVDLEVTYRPDRPGRDVAQIDLLTNDPDRARIELPVEGTAMDPTIEVEPATLGFGWVRSGLAATRSITIRAGGTGRLDIRDVVFEDPDASDGFALQFPDPLPASRSAGETLAVSVTFRPAGVRGYRTRLEVVSNAVNPEDRFVELVGNGDVDPEVNAPPLVAILTPRRGTQVLPGQGVPVTALTFDEEDDPDQLVVQLRVDGVPVGTAVPDATGRVDFEAVAGARDTTTLEVTVLDTEGAEGVDRTEVDVLDLDEPTRFVISGGPSPSDPFTIDDDVRIEVDGVTVFEDANTLLDTHAPVAFDAFRSSEIRIVLTDQQFCKAESDALILHAQLGGEQPLNPEICVSACENDPCFDPVFDGPWPSVYLDERYIIAIP